MNDSKASPPAPVLTYATPSARRGRPVLAVLVAILGIGAGLFGALMLFYGIAGVLYVCTRDNGADFPSDLIVVVLFLVIGIFCCYVALRWCRAVRRIFSGT
ncbi:MAG TPA: hypothetical protein VGI81_20480 [Tepidisphaeraceae bacterium]|jgi:hypothetical protein